MCIFEILVKKQNFFSRTILQSNNYLCEKIRFNFRFENKIFQTRLPQREMIGNEQWSSDIEKVINYKEPSAINFSLACFLLKFINVKIKYLEGGTILTLSRSLKMIAWISQKLRKWWKKFTNWEKCVELTTKERLKIYKLVLNQENWKFLEWIKVMVFHNVLRSNEINSGVFQF